MTTKDSAPKFIFNELLCPLFGGESNSCRDVAVWPWKTNFDAKIKFKEGSIIWSRAQQRPINTARGFTRVFKWVKLSLLRPYHSTVNTCMSSIPLPTNDVYMCARLSASWCNTGKVLVQGDRGRIGQGEEDGCAWSLQTAWPHLGLAVKTLSWSHFSCFKHNGLT